MVAWLNGLVEALETIGASQFIHKGVRVSPRRGGNGDNIVSKGNNHRPQIPHG